MISFCIFCSPIPVLSNGTCFMQLRVRCVGVGGGGGGKTCSKKNTPLSNEARVKPP